MRFKISCLLFFSVCCHYYSICAQTRIKNAVVFGEHINKAPNTPKDVIRVFMDRNGDYYPDATIRDEELKDKRKGKSQLKIWAKNHISKFKTIAESYNLTNTDYSDNAYKILQDSIVSRIATTVNKTVSDSKTFLIHGFKKEFYNKSGNSKSLKDNTNIENRIRESYIANNGHLFIEVYWDGLYTHRGPVDQGKIFAFYAIPNAKRCGYSLRKLFARLNDEEMNIINHSTGAFVAAHLLFNAKKSYDLATPSNNLNILFVAPASGRKLFKFYYKRNTNIDFKKADNYHIYNAYNLNDFALTKGNRKKNYAKVGVDTSLGCNYKDESSKLKETFKSEYFNSTYKDYLIDDIGYVHYFSFYMNSSKITPALNELYGE